MITQKGLRKFGVNIWITDMDMQCLASSPAISPLIQRYDKESPDLILNRLSQLTTEPTSEQRTQPKGKRKINEDGDKIVQKSKVEMKKRRKREMK